MPIIDAGDAFIGIAGICAIALAAWVVIILKDWNRKPKLTKKDLEEISKAAQELGKKKGSA